MSTQSILPDNRTVLEVALEETIKQQLADIPAVFPAGADADDISVDLLPWLAESKGVQRWGVNQAEAERREAVKTIWPLQREGGMRSAIKRALKAAGFDAEVVPWHKMVPKADPYLLQVTGWAVDKPITEAQRLDVLRRVGDAMSERDKLAVRLGRQSVAPVRVAGLVQTGKLITASPYVLEQLQRSAAASMGAAVHSMKTMTIQAAA